MSRLTIFQPEKPTKMGVMMVGLGGNNGSTFRYHHYRYHDDILLGSILHSADVPTANLPCHDPRINLSKLLASRNLPATMHDIVGISGWEARGGSVHSGITEAGIVAPNVAKACGKSPFLTNPLPLGIVDPAFIGLEGIHSTRMPTLRQEVELLQRDIKAFEERYGLDTVVVFYSGSTERAPYNPPDSATWVRMLQATKASEIPRDKDGITYEVSPSQVYAIAAATSRVHCCFINGAAQNTFAPFVKGLFEQSGRIAVGSDLCTGQTRLKSALLDTFLGHGLPITSILNFNALGNRDGLSLQALGPNQSKVQSKSTMVDQIHAACPTLYQDRKMDHVVHISYSPSIGDNKRALDEYVMETPLQGTLDMTIQSKCPDTLLALGVMLDLILCVVAMDRTLVDGKKLAQLKNSFDKTNAIVACLLKNPCSSLSRPFYHENRDVLVGFLLELCGVEPETIRHRSFLTL